MSNSRSKLLFSLVTKNSPNNHVENDVILNNSVGLVRPNKVSTFMKQKDVDTLEENIESLDEASTFVIQKEVDTEKENESYNNNAIVLKHTDFLDWTEVCNSVFSKPKMTDNNNHEVKFKEIRSVCLVQNKPDEMKIAYSFFIQEDSTINYSTIDLKANTKLRSSVSRRPSIKPLYSNRLPLSNVKYKDLQKLCLKRIIPECYHHEYLDLPQKCGVSDELPETDEDE